MTSWNPQANDVFLKALDLPGAEERRKFLDEVCPDPALRAEVAAMLDAHARADSFLEQPAPPLPSPSWGEGPGVRGGATLDEPTSERPGTVIGPYKLLQQIGEGGFGVVYMAEQTEPVRRKVALKILKPGMDTRQVVARFEAERQALAIMDHPNIAKVHDGGATPPSPPSQGGAWGGGRPFFVMELVKGVPITEFCDQNHLTPRQRLELFVPVCQAVQHAHQKGIIHRDLKPSNILVVMHDTTPVPKVIDFGIAKALGQELTDKTLFTAFAQMVGTPLYMSPEQAGQSGLDIDTRSDIYSLGVLLYELLTGTTPFDKERFKQAAYDEIRRIIREEDPPKPSTRLSDSKDSLPSISAQRQTEPAKLTKLVRGELDWIVMKALEKDRNRRYETANGFAMDVQRYLADEAVLACPPSAAYRFRKFARRNKTAIAMVGVVFFFIMVVGGVLGWAMRDRAAREQEIAHEEARKHALTEAGIREALDRATNGRADLHAVLKKPGGVQQLLNQPARWELFLKTAQGELTQARRLTMGAEGSLDVELRGRIDQLDAQMASDQADYKMAQRLEQIRLDMATWLDDGAIDQAVVGVAAVGAAARKAAKEYSQALAVIAVLTDDADVVAARIASSPIRDQIVAVLDTWASLEFFYGERSAEQLMAVARLALPDPAWGDRLRQPTIWRDWKAIEKVTAELPAHQVSPQLHDLVYWLLRDGPYLEAWLRKAQAEYPGDFWLNYNLQNLLSKSSPAEAAGFCRVAIAIRPTSASAYNNLGVSLRRQKKLPEAKAAFRRAIQLNSRESFAYSNLGILLAEDEKNLPEAIDWLRKAVDLDPKNATPHSGLANVMRAQGKLDDAVVGYRKAIDLNPNYIPARAGLANTLQAQGKLDEAVGENKKAIELAPKNVVLRSNLGLVLIQQKKYEEAIAALRQAIEVDPKHARAHIHLGTALREQGKVDEAIVAYGKAIEPARGEAGAHSGRAMCYASLGRWDKAAADCERNAELAPWTYVPWRSAAYAHWAAGDGEGYRRNCQELVKRFGRTNYVGGAARIAMTCSLAPGSVADFGAVERLAQRAVTGTEKDSSYREFVLSKGVTESRAGRHEDAIQWLERVTPKTDGGHWDAMAFAALAISRHGLGQIEEARESLAQAQAILNQKMPDPSKGRLFPGYWHEWLHAQFLTREAAETLMKQPEVKKPESKTKPK